MSNRAGIFGWLARALSGILGLATHTPGETRELREEIAARRAAGSTQGAEDTSRAGHS